MYKGEKTLSALVVQGESFPVPAQNRTIGKENSNGKENSCNFVC